MATLDCRGWQPHNIAEIEQLARRYPADWTITCTLARAHGFFEVIVFDDTKKEFTRRAFDYADFDAVARFLEAELRKIPGVQA